MLRAFACAGHCHSRSGPNSPYQTWPGTQFLSLLLWDLEFTRESLSPGQAGLAFSWLLCSRLIISLWFCLIMSAFDWTYCWQAKSNYVMPKPMFNERNEIEASRLPCPPSSASYLFLTFSPLQTSSNHYASVTYAYDDMRIWGFHPDNNHKHHCPDSLQQIKVGKTSSAVPPES